MKNNTLVLIDWVAGFLIGPIIIFVKIIKIAATKFHTPRRNGRLIVKFLGAGNYVAMSNLIDENTTIISALSNKSAIEYFLRPKEVFYIDDSSFSDLAMTSLGAILFAMKSSHKEVINLETESKFSKLLISLARSEVTLGVTNVHKSYMDMLIYDRYLVNPVSLGKTDSINLLTKFELIQNQPILSAIKKSQLDFLENVSFHKPILNIAFAPTGSDTDIIRRVKPDIWLMAANKLLNHFPDAKIDLFFPSKKDIQYEAFESFFTNEPRINFCVEGYKDYVQRIGESDLVVCIDSQTLHVANFYKVPVICFFGPSSPYGVNHSQFTYPISLAAACSPCRHKYFQIPCKGNVVCMDFIESDLEIFDRLRDLCA